MQKTRIRKVSIPSPTSRVSRLARGVLSSVVLASTVTGCADADSITSEGAPLEEEVDETPSSLHWTSCPKGFQERCARLDVPLNRRAKDSEHIEVMISKRAAKRKVPEAQLWLLMGGPGNSADLFEYQGTLDKFALALPGVDIYTIEHRGVGESTKLECPNGDPSTPQEIEACVSALNEQYDGQLTAFSTTEAAQDVEYALSLTRNEEIPQFLYGVSYGTYLAQRYLTLYPDGVAGVILDSVVLPSQKLNAYDSQTDVIAQRIAALCAKDSACSEKLGADPWSVVEDVVARVEQGHCPEAGVQDFLGPALAAYLTVIDLREVVLPLIYRLDRCEPDDAIAMQNSLAYLETTAPDVSRTGNVLRMNVVVSELWDHGASEAEMLGACDGATLCPGVGPLVAPFVRSWPTYTDPLTGQWPRTNTPILTMNGNLDAQTPIEMAVQIQEHYDGKYQYFVEFEEGPHGLVDWTPVTDPEAPTCGAQVVADFVTDPRQRPNTGCLEAMVGMDVVGNSQKATAILGMTDMWENEAK